MLKNDQAQESRKDRKKRVKLEAIVAAGRHLFAEQGYEQTTTRAIAERADIATGTLFVYFPEKRDLLIHIYRLDLGATTDRQLDDIDPDHDLVGACMQVFDAAYSFYAEDPDLARAFVKEMMFLKSTDNPAMFQTTMRFLDRLGALVNAAKERGEVRVTVGTPLVAQQMFATYYWGLINWLGSGLFDRSQVSAITRMNLELLMTGLNQN